MTRDSAPAAPDDADPEAPAAGKSEVRTSAAATAQLTRTLIYYN